MKSTAALINGALFGLAGAACVGSLDEEERARFGVLPDAGTVDAGPAPDAGPSCPDVLATVLGSTEGPKGCAQTACHSTNVASQGLDFESPDLFGRLSGQASANCSGEVYIDPQDPASSLIYKKIGPGPYPCGGGRMPIGPPLSDTEIACILTLIEQQTSGGADAGVADTGADAGVVDTGAPDAGSAPQLDFEAETMMLAAPFGVASDPMASGGQYVTRPTGTLNPDPFASGVGRATIEFTLPENGPTRIFARVRAASSDNDSFWVRVDQEAWVRWNDLFIESSGNWAWDDVHDSDNTPENAQIFDLMAGAHTLEVVFREPNAQLDRVIITQDPGFTPPSDED